MFPQIVGNTSGTLLWVAKEQTKERLARDSRDESGLKVHVLLRFFPHQNVDLFHMYSQRRVRVCFLLPHQASGCNDNFGFRDSPGAVLHGQVIPGAGCVSRGFLRPTALTKSLACSLSSAREASNLVMARPAGFSL